MAHLWSQSVGGEWQPSRLDARAVALSATTPHVRALPGDLPASERSLVVLCLTGEPASDEWTLLVGREARVLVNGLAVDLGIASLADRDEIRWPMSPPLFFSREQLAIVVPFPADILRGLCPRCKQTIGAGDSSVRCPGCGLWHHAAETLPCWTYADSCAACSQPTKLDAGFRWSPEEV